MSGLFWVYYTLGSIWEQEILDGLEERICTLLREELVL
jgi:hypothetical protein